MKRHDTTRSSFFRKFLFITLTTLFVSLAQEALAATYTVDTTADYVAYNACTSEPNDCSLRGAIANANANRADGYPVDDTIEFAIPLSDSGCTSAGVCTITTLGGVLTIGNAAGAGKLTITNSSGANKLIISGNDQFDVFYNDAGILTLNGITVAHGKAPNSLNNGGYTAAGITNNQGALTITNSIVSENVGRAIVNFGSMTIASTTITNNSILTPNNGDVYAGGGIANRAGELTITGSTISGNSAIQGGGLAMSNYGQATITNSTISGNTAVNGGGGIYMFTLNVLYAEREFVLAGVTITDNSSTAPDSYGGGISYDHVGEHLTAVYYFVLNNSIVAGNHNVNAPDLYVPVAPQFSDIEGCFNLIGDNTGGPNSTATQQCGSQIGTAASPIDPKLGPLADNGGPTKTHALLAGSPAIDKGNSAGLTTDQRGSTRPVDLSSTANASGGDGADIGAFEVQTSSPCSAISLSPSSLAGGTAGSSYSQTVSASGGGGSYSYSVSSGALPAGLVLDAATGEISGTPTASGTFNFTITATDSNGCAGSQTYSITIDPFTCPAITLNPSSLPGGTVGSAYNETISALGSSETFTYSITSGLLPTGLSLDPATGVISGSPTIPDSYTFTVTATGAGGCQGSAEYTIVVTFSCPTITLSSGTLAGGTVNTLYSQTVSAMGGVGGYTFTVSGGALPGGLSLNQSTGEISGTPTFAGTFNFTLTATDSNGCTGSQAYSISVASAPVVSNPPAAPKNLKVDFVGANRIQIIWTDASSNETGFAIEGCKTKNCKNFVELGRVGANTTTYLHTGLFTNTQYYYRVRAFNAAGNSAYTNVVSATTLKK